MADYRDSVIEELADSEARLLERIGELEEAVARYRILAVAAIHDLARLTTERDAKARQLAALREEYTALRARVKSGTSTTFDRPFAKNTGVPRDMSLTAEAATC